MRYLYQQVLYKRVSFGDDDPMPRKSHAVTAAELATVVTQLEGEACTARRVRYLLGGLLPMDGGQRGRTRLYGAIDVALMRLAVRLEAAGVSAWVVRVVLAYCGDEIRAAWRSGAAVALSVRGVTGWIHSARPEADGPVAVACVPLRSVLAGNESAIRQARRARPNIWMWRACPAASLPQRLA